MNSVQYLIGNEYFEVYLLGECGMSGELKGRIASRGASRVARVARALGDFAHRTTLILGACLNTPLRRPTRGPNITYLRVWQNHRVWVSH